MGSSRFPGKPLVKILNKTPMIGFIYNNIKNSKVIRNSYVATCDEEICNYIKSINGNYVMTKKT